MSRRKIKNQGPPPRAGFAVDAVLQKSGNIVDIRRIYVGPRNLDPADLVELLSAVVAVAMINCLRDPVALSAAKEDLLKKIDERITVRRDTDAAADPNRGEEPQPVGVEETPNEAKENEDGK